MGTSYVPTRKHGKVLKLIPEVVILYNKTAHVYSDERNDPHYYSNGVKRTIQNSAVPLKCLVG